MHYTRNTVNLKNTGWARDTAQQCNCVPGKHKVLSSIPRERVREREKTLSLLLRAFNLSFKDIKQGIKLIYQIKDKISSGTQDKKIITVATRSISKEMKLMHMLWVQHQTQLV